jgi:hypothetical protein
MTSARTRFIIPLLLFLFSIIITIPQIRKPLYTETDPYIHSLIAKAFKDSGSLQKLYTGLWLPLYPLLLGGALHMVDDFTFTPRVVNLFFSSATVVLVYLYCGRLLNLSSPKASLAALVYLFFPYRFLVGTIPFTEQVFTFFLLLSLIQILKDKPNYILGICSYLIAQGIRYEAWYLTPLIMWYIYKSKQSSKRKLIFLITLVIVPILWMVINYNNSNNPLFFLTNMRANSFAGSSHSYLNLKYSLTGWWQNLLELFSSPILLLSLLGFLSTTKKRKDKFLVGFLISIITLIALVFLSFFAVLEWFPPRYLLLILPFVISYSVIGLSKIYEVVKVSIIKKNHWVIIPFIITGTIFAVIYIRPIFPAAIKISQGNFYPSGRISNFQDLVTLCIDLGCGNKVDLIYFYRKEEPLHHLFALRYHVKIPHDIEEKSTDSLSVETLPTNTLIVIEKESSKFKNILFSNTEILLNNSSYIALKVNTSI